MTFMDRLVSAATPALVAQYAYKMHYDLPSIWVDYWNIWIFSAFAVIKVAISVISLFEEKETT